MSIKSFFSLLISTVCLFAVGLATAQSFPNRPIMIVVANTPGNPLDSTPRFLAPEMSRILGVPVVVENKPGAGQVLGYEYVLQQPADGYTILMAARETTVQMALLVSGLRLDPIKDLPPFIGLASIKLILGVNSSQPWKTFNDLIAYAKSNPGKLNYSSASAANEVAFGIIQNKFGLDIVRVNYKGTEASQRGVLSGETHVGIFTEASASGFGDKVRLLAQTGEKRGTAFPNVPTFLELGFPIDIPAGTFTLNLRAGTPKDVVDKLYGAAARALNQPEMKALFAKQFMTILEPADQTGDAAQKRMAEQAGFLADIIKKVGIQPQPL